MPGTAQFPPSAMVVPVRAKDPALVVVAVNTENVLAAGVAVETDAVTR